MLHLSSVVDGFADTPEDKDMLQRADEIIEKLPLFERFEVSEVKSSNYMYFLKLCKYAISRGWNTFTMFLEDAYAQGHTALFVARQYNIASNMREEFVEFNHVLLELGYAKRKQFVDRIHLCPHCKNSHLYYMEACPKCDSSLLKEEPVLHHFRCANISPESSYAYDGELRCPKCHQFLRHIGVDYDRPSNVYTCQECNHTFLHTRMKVHCSSCNKTLRPSELLPFDVYTYEYTSEGILALSSNDAVVAVSKDIWGGYSNFDSFLSQIRLFTYSHSMNEIIYINRYKVEGTQSSKDIIMRIVGDLQKRFYYNNLTYKDSFIFMATKVSSDISDEQWKGLEEEYDEAIKVIELKYAGVNLVGRECFHLLEDEKISEFFKRICRAN
jgi:rubrerythrin